MAQCEAALVGNDRLLWRVLGYQIEDERFYSDRKVICDECEDRVCAMCWRTEIYRWIRSQRCPLGEW